MSVASVGVLAGQVRGAREVVRIRAFKVVGAFVCSRIRQNSDRMANRPNTGEFGDMPDYSAFRTLKALVVGLVVFV